MVCRFYRISILYCRQHLQLPQRRDSQSGKLTGTNDVNERSVAVSALLLIDIIALFLRLMLESLSNK